MEQEIRRKWRWGVNRWWILGFVVLSIVGASLFSPVLPHIQVAPEPLSHHPLFSLPGIGDVYLTNTMTAMILVDFILLGIAFAVRQSLRKGNLVPSGISGAMEALVEVLYNLTETSAGRYARQIFPWFATIFLVVLTANLTKLLPIFETFGFIEEAVKDGHAVQHLGWAATVIPAEGEFVLLPIFRGVATDLNFTVSLAIIAVTMVQVIGVQAQGPKYFLKFFNVRTLFNKPFFGFIDLAVSILELISELAKVLSFSFRLFGVIFSGSVLLALVGSMLPVFAPSLIFAFELFMGAIQAFVFGMLTMVFMAQATQGHGEHEEMHA